MKRLLWWILAGTKGGPNRARIIELIHERPLNANQLAEKLGMDYKTIRHHLSVLAENDIITTTANGKYGAMYFLSSHFDENYSEFEQIREQIGKK